MQYNVHSHPIHYRTTGNGPTVLLLHGFAEDGTIWLELAEQLRQHYRLIIPDLPGSGQSALVEGANIDSYATLIHQIIAQENPGHKTILIGHSMGGYIGLAWAEKYPDQVAGLGLFHSTAYADSDERKNIRRKAIAFVKEKGTKLFFESTISNLFTADFAATNTLVLQQQVSLASIISVAAVAQYYQAMIDRPDRRFVLQQLKQPVLFVMGRHDKAVPIAQNLTECYLPAQSHVHILENSAHMGMLEEKELTLAAIQHFLASVTT
jgi:pimeloyl-ACP methyl ester carboxylesterase